MNLQLIVGRTKTGKSTYIYKQIEAMLATKVKENIILLVQEQTNYSSEYTLIKSIDKDRFLQI